MRAMIVISNVGSQKVAEKCQMKQTGKVEYTVIN